MKLSGAARNSRLGSRANSQVWRPAPREEGVALLIVLFMVSFMVIFVTANANALFGLKREIKVVDQRQKARWAEIGAKTNRVEEVKK